MKGTTLQAHLFRILLGPVGGVLPGPPGTHSKEHCNECPDDELKDEFG